MEFFYRLQILPTAASKDGAANGAIFRFLPVIDIRNIGGRKWSISCKNAKNRGCSFFEKLIGHDGISLLSSNFGYSIF